MPEKIAVVGPRKGADLDAVRSFVRSLFTQQPDAIVLSGGAEGVDQAAETEWVALGGRAWSYRIRKFAQDRWGVVKWELGPNPRVFELLGEPSWLDPTSALYYRDMIVAEEANKVCAFSGIDRMRGTEFTVWVSAEAERKETWVYRDGEWERRDSVL